MFELTCSPNNYKMICAFVDVSLIDVSSGVMVYAVDPFIDFLSLVISQGRAKARVSLTSPDGSCRIDVRIQLLLSRRKLSENCNKNLHILSTPIC